jgi:ribose transport system permease protein
MSETGSSHLTTSIATHYLSARASGIGSAVEPNPFDLKPSRCRTRLSGLAVGHLRFGAMVAGSFLAAVDGVLFAGTSGSADPNSGDSFMLPAFAAAFLGSTSIVPGRFNAWGSFAAVYFLVNGIYGLSLMGIQVFIQNLF